MYQYVLANLLANNDDALGVLFLDGSSETVDLACADFSPYENARDRRLPRDLPAPDREDHAPERARRDAPGAHREDGGAHLRRAAARRLLPGARAAPSGAGGAGARHARRRSRAAARRALQLSVS